MADAVPDPFAHHPELRGKIVDPLSSFFRTITVESLIERNPDMAHILDWVHSDEMREANRRQFLDGQTDGDLWIFAYGSLMWDPAFIFAEVRRARVSDYSRRFILKDDKGGRGTKERPGLIAALDRGDGCDGLAFRIRAHDIEQETEILWRREVIGPGYIPTFVPTVIGDRVEPALTFVADHAVEMIVSDLARDEQIRLIATGEGTLGTSRDYLGNIVSQFDRLGIVDEDCSDLLREVEAYLAQSGPTSPPSSEGIRR